MNNRVEDLNNSTKENKIIFVPQITFEQIESTFCISTP